MFKWLNKEQKNELNQLPIFKNVEYFDIQVGWFEEIKKIGLEIQEYCDKNNNPYPEVTQIKTKFGEIRVSYKNSNLINFNNFFEKINHNCEYCGSIKNVDIIIRDRSNCYFVEVQNDGLNKYDSIKYITRNSNYRFNFLDKEIIFEEDKKIEVENNDDNEVSMFDNYDFKDSIKIIDDKACNIIANNLDVNLSNSDIQLNVNEIKNILSDIKESIYCGESFSDIEKDIFKLMNLTKEVSLKDKEDKDLKESILNDVTLNFRF